MSVPYEKYRTYAEDVAGNPQANDQERLRAIEVAMLCDIAESLNMICVQLPFAGCGV